MLPDSWDKNQRDYYKSYKYAPSDEITRKLGVCRSNIIAGQDVERFAQKQAVLWYIQSKNEKRRRRYQFIGEIRLWLGLFVGFVLGVIASPWIRSLIESTISGGK